MRFASLLTAGVISLVFSRPGSSPYFYALSIMHSEERRSRTTDLNEESTWVFCVELEGHRKRDGKNRDSNQRGGRFLELTM